MDCGRSPRPCVAANEAPPGPRDNGCSGSSTAWVLCPRGRRRLSVLPETPNVDGERSFWSTGPGRRLCTRENMAALDTQGFLAFPFAQSQLFLFFFSNVIRDCTEIIIIFSQEILHFKIINEQCFQTFF